jgi:DNA (cytosine-5)-methyltransferase 1
LAAKATFQATRTHVPSATGSRVRRPVRQAAKSAPKPRISTKSKAPKSVELFVGAGGLAMGLHRVGFKPALAVDWDEPSIGTLRANKKRYTRGWTLRHEDVQTVDYGTLELGDIDVVSAGAPCQPFSVGGQLRGEGDPRNMFPEVVRAVRELVPRAFVFENVRGLLFPRNRPYLDYILAQLRVPSRTRRPDEHWRAHFAALQAIPEPEHEYRVDWRLLNAADFGLAQYRPRLVVVGVSVDEQRAFAWPEPTHGKDALLRALLADEYWERHGVPRKIRKSVRARLNGKKPGDDNLLPWMTLRDVVSRLGPPLKDGAKGDAAHVAVPGARLYKKHAGSVLDWPGKTVKAGVHGCPGGEHIVLLDDGSHRYLTVRECAVLQGFPDDYNLPTLRTHAMRQLGNAVPVALSEAVGSRLMQVVA